MVRENKKNEYPYEDVCFNEHFLVDKIRGGKVDIWLVCAACKFNYKNEHDLKNNNSKK